MVTKNLMRLIASIAFVVMLPSASFAQATGFDRMTPPLPTAGERKAADIASWVTVSTLLALDFTEALRDKDNRTHKIQMFAVRQFSTFVMASLAKGLTNRERPDGSNRMSFYSGHTATAFSTLGGPRVAIAIPFAVSTGGLRIAAGKHYLTDVLVGAGVGALTSRLR